VRNRAAIIGAGVSGLTCGVVLAEHEWNVTIFADETGEQTTSAAAAAVWFPYDAEPADKIITRSLIT
jgi:D-amino-acid oxidase